MIEPSASSTTSPDDSRPDSHGARALPRPAASNGTGGAVKIFTIMLIAFLTVGAGLSVWQAWDGRAQLAADKQKIESMELSSSAEKKQRTKNEKSLQEARAAAITDRAIAEFLTSLLIPEASLDGDKEQYAVREALAKGVKLLNEGMLSTQPEAELRLRRTIGEAYLSIGMAEEAEPQMRLVLETTRAKVDKASPELLESLCGLARVLTALNKPEGQALYDESTALYDQLVAKEPWRRVMTLYGMAEGTVAEGNFEKAIGLSEYAQDLLRRQFGLEHPHSIMSRVRLASVIRRAGKIDEARRMANVGLDMLRRRLPPGHPGLGEALIGVGQVELDAERFDAAEAVLRECLEIRSTKLPEGHWQTANAKVILGRAVAGLKRYEEAEALLIEGFEELKKNNDTPPIRLQEACEAIVAFYGDREDSENASKYEAILEKMKKAEARAENRRPPVQRE